jgi:hypothetical protein
VRADHPSVMRQAAGLQLKKNGAETQALPWAGMNQAVGLGRHHQVRSMKMGEMWVMTRGFSPRNQRPVAVGSRQRRLHPPACLVNPPAYVQPQPGLAAFGAEDNVVVETGEGIGHSVIDAVGLRERAGCSRRRSATQH